MCRSRTSPQPPRRGRSGGTTPSLVFFFWFVSEESRRRRPKTRASPDSPCFTPLSLLLAASKQEKPLFFPICNSRTMAGAPGALSRALSCCRERVARTRTRLEREGERKAKKKKIVQARERGVERSHIFLASFLPSPELAPSKSHSQQFGYSALSSLAGEKRRIMQQKAEKKQHRKSLHFIPRTS